MSDTLAQIANLSPEKRKLLDALLQEKGVDISRSIIVPQDRKSNTFPLSFAQQRLWFLEQLEPGSPSYNIPMAVRLKGRLNIKAMEQSLHEIFKRHEVLRTSFGSENGQPMQIIAPSLSPTLPVVDLRHLTEIEREAEAKLLASKEARKPFNLTSNPMLRATLIRLSEEEYIVLLTMHHIASDGWSMRVLISEIAALYESFSSDKSSPLSDLPIQYVDFACWQREFLQGNILETQLDYWKRSIGDDLGVLELPTDRPRPSYQSNRGSSYTFQLSKHLLQSLRVFGQQERVTIFMTLLAAFQTLLYRYTGQENVKVGTPIANRNRKEIEGLIGFFVNTLVMSGHLSGAPTFQDLLKQIREMTLGAYAHQDLPFEMLVEELQPERDMSHAPLFQVMFVLQNPSVQPLNLPDLVIEPVETNRETATFDLTLSMTDGAEISKGYIEYNTDLFNESTIEQMVGNFRRLLQGIVANPKQSISELPLLTDVEQQQLLVDWNATKMSAPTDRCAHELFEDQVKKRPEALALIFHSTDSRRGEDVQLSYAELNLRANQLAQYLKKLGVGPDVLVGISAERSPEMVVAILGTLKAGGAYLPLDPTYPPQRLAFMVEDSQIRVLLTQQHLIEQLPDAMRHAPCSKLLLDADWETVAHESEQNPVSNVTPDNLAYVIYTSGSTGKPKGTMLEHAGLSNLTAAQRQTFGIREGSRVLQFSPFSFDASVWEIFMALANGGTLCLAQQEVLASGTDLAKLLHTQAVTNVTLPPSMLRVLPAEKLPHLETIVVAGEKCTAELVQSWASGRQFFNAYGPTETTVCGSMKLCNAEQDGDPPIGRPIANGRLYILDSSRQPVPMGVPGELCIGGVSVARGYLNRPDLTAEKFIPDFFCDEPGMRLYRTGDLVKYRPDGDIEFLGRIDHQVKVRGFRIELGEIEAVLRQMESIKEAVVLAADGRLIAYVGAAMHLAPTAAELRDAMRQRLPDYMVPSMFIILEQLPLTPNGKVDRKALPPPEDAARDGQREYVAPRTPAEEILVELWAQVLGVERVGIHDNFYDLGGHSLLATQLISRIHKTFEVEVGLRDLFEVLTVAGLAQRLEAALKSASGLQAPPINPVPRQSELPLSFAQQRLWFFDQFEPDTALYNIPSAIRLEGKLDVGALEKSLNEIVRRHENLRTIFAAEYGQAKQVILPELILELPLIDLSEIPMEEREAEASRRLTEEAQQPFNLTTGPLLRATLLRLEEEIHLAIIVMHHIVSDGWSAGVLIREIAALYMSFSEGESSPLSELPIQYSDFAHWQRSWLQGEVLEDHLTYWKEQLAGLPPMLELPTDRPRPAVQTVNGNIQTFVIPPKFSEAIKALGQQEGATLFMTLLAAFYVLLYRYTGKEDISIGTPIANRNRAEIEDLIGCFINTLVLRSDLSGESTFRELLKRVKEIALQAYAHQDLPFEMLVDELGVDRDTSHTPLFQVMFILQNAPFGDVELPDLKIGRVELGTETATFDLTLTMGGQADELYGGIEYNTDLFDASTIERMIEHFRMLLQGIVADLDLPISDLPLLMDAERKQLLAVWNETTTDDLQADICIQQLFEAQAERMPDTAAIIFPTEDASRRTRMTYRELNAKANQLAHYLKKLGVGPETIVGCSVERSPEMIVALLGILKAGGAYLPLDPDYPSDRLAFMLEDSQASVLLTQRHLVEHLPNPNTKSNIQNLIRLDADWPEISQETESNPPVRSRPENLAYLVFTSGSTGKPKGVLIRQRSLANAYLAWEAAYQLKPGLVHLQMASFAFDVFSGDFVRALCSGGTLVLCPRDYLLAPDRLYSTLKTERVDCAEFVPAVLRCLIEYLEETKQDLAFMKLLICGSDLWYAKEYKYFQRFTSPNTRLINSFGLAEATIDNSYFETQELVISDDCQVPIGCAFANTQLYVLDQNTQLVPQGVHGELYIGGAGVARGYLNQPDLTAEKFIPDPFSERPGSRLYKTGDLVRYLPDGNIDCLGRIDYQVKIRGFRVELGEIEAVLRQHSNVRDAVVCPHEDGSLKHLAAYVVQETCEKNSDITELREYLRAELPNYMVPSFFVELDAMPLTPNGKVDRRALPAPDGTRPELASAYVAPRNQKEQILANIWMQLLNLEQVGVYDNFFELGGDSIISIQAIARAKQAGLHLTPRQLFESPTVAGLAAVAGTGKVIHADQATITGSVPLTPIQSWFFEQKLPEPHHWNQSVLLEVKHALEPKRLENAVDCLLRHHDAMRMRFKQKELKWEQYNADVNGDIPFTWIDLSGLPKEKQVLAVENRAAELQTGLNLEQGPLLRIAYFNLGTGKSARLFLAVHHLVMDGISWRILIEDLQTAYGQLAGGEKVQLPPKTTSFQYWALRLQEYAQKEEVYQELPYWLAVTQKGVNNLPVDFPDGVNTEASTQMIAVELDQDKTHALLKEVPSAYRTEINDVLLAALALAMNHWTNAKAVLVELEGHGREDILDDVDISRTVGWFTADYPVAIDLNSTDGLGAILKAVKEELRRVPRRGIGYSLLRYLYAEEGVSKQLRQLPQPQVSFNYLGQFDQMAQGDSPFATAAESQGFDRSPRGVRSNLIDINGGIGGGKLRLEWTYSENLHRRSTVERLAEHYMNELRAIIAHCQSSDTGGVTPSDFKLANLNQQKLDRILAKLNHTKASAK